MALDSAMASGRVGPWSKPRTPWGRGRKKKTAAVDPFALDAGKQTMWFGQ